MTMTGRRLILDHLDPVRQIRNATPDQVSDAISACHREAGSRFIVGAGCEIPVDTPPANLRSLAAHAQARRS
jgi:uroporphyrinogen-III decarboxylase